MRLIAKVNSGRYRFVLSDLFVPLAGLWMFIGPTVNNDFSDTLVHSGPVALEFMMSYFSTRVFLSCNEQSLTLVSFLCLVISFVALDGLLDTATGRLFTRDLVDQVTGYFINENGGTDLYRFGLRRAAGPLEHPILFGFTSAIGFLFAVSIDMPWRKFCMAACAIGVVIAFSSAPEQAMIMGLGLLAYSRIFVHVRRKWLLFSIAPLVTVVALFLITPTPFGHVFDLVTIDPGTAYYRLYIWQSVGPAILQNPLFSVLESTYDYQGSIDSVWLVLSLAYGMPCSILTGLSMVGACSLATDHFRARLSQAEERLGTTLGIEIFLIIFMGFTVHFWGSAWITVGLLVGVRAHLGELGRLNLDRSLGADVRRHENLTPGDMRN
jgi:hypothetical protein